MVLSVWSFHVGGSFLWSWSLILSKWKCNTGLAYFAWNGFHLQFLGQLSSLSLRSRQIVQSTSKSVYCNILYTCCLLAYLWMQPYSVETLIPITIYELGVYAVSLLHEQRSVAIGVIIIGVTIRGTQVQYTCAATNPHSHQHTFCDVI